MSEAIKKIYKLIFISLLCISCNKKSRELSPSEYLNYFNSNGLQRTIETGIHKYVVCIRTPEFMALKETSEPNHLDLEKYRNRIKQIDKNIYFIINIFADEKEVKGEQSKYYQDVNGNIKIEIDEHSIFKPTYCYYEDNYGLAPYNTLIVCSTIDINSIKKSLRIKYYDKLHDDIINASYSASEINCLPSLSL